MVHGWQRVRVDLLRNRKAVETGVVNKLYLGFRGLVHYGKTWDLYSGIKVGYVYKRAVSVETSPGETPYLQPLNNDIVFQLGFVLFGAYYPFSDRMGAGTELSLGSPHVFALGFRYRFL